MPYSPSEASPWLRSMMQRNAAIKSAAENRGALQFGIARNFRVYQA